MAGIYIHIPFCKKACNYCDFHFSTTLNLVDKVVDSIIKEAERMKHYLTQPVDTIYLGGGTPSILDQKQFGRVVDSLFKNYQISNDIEFTVEANPDDLNDKKMKLLKDLGVNRLSIGTQSFDDDVLLFLNRSHSAKQTREAVELSNKHGIENISLDLIYGIPGQSKSKWELNLKKLIELNPSHISCYALTIENKTAFGNWVKKGKLIPTEDEVVADEYDFMIDMLGGNGYDHYEVSNFSKPGFFSKHNSSYWHQKPYLGLGPGAHSFNGQERHFNVSNNPKYIKAIEENNNPYETEQLSANEQLTEQIFTRIRTKWGVDFNMLSDQFNFQLTDKQLTYIRNLVSDKMATFVDRKLILNSNGFFIADAVALELIPEY